ncbi:BrnT family toxin [Candidatus Gottesmanbacteria bacterium]|nr:BrnT family toxin [Candidatus Gottesmanbacteria bacterium]
MKEVGEVFEFQWDRGNIGKNKKHKVEDRESEEPFFDEDKIIHKDIFHSKKEERFILIGKTKKGRLLYIVFTKRNSKFRTISARDINKKEVQIYEKAA